MSEKAVKGELSANSAKAEGVEGDFAKAEESEPSTDTTAEKKSDEKIEADRKADKTPDGLRLFIGVAVSMRSLRALSNAADALQKACSNKGIRWVSPARYHVTLAYLGWTRPEAVPAIRDAVSKAIAGQKAFEIRHRDLGAFPSLEKAEVLWAGVQDEESRLAKLATSLREALIELGFEMPKGEFVPHVTMARIRPGQSLLKEVQAVPEQLFSKSLVDRLLLYKSSVESDASEYEKIAAWPLE